MAEDVLKDARVTLLEDNNFLADVITQKLTSVGSKIERYRNGLEGLAAVREEKPDLVLLDIMMPVMNGYEVLEVMATEGLMKKVPVIIISNSGQPIEIQRVMDLGVKDYLVKADFTPEEVLEKARSVLTAMQQTESGISSEQQNITNQASKETPSQDMEQNTQTTPASQGSPSGKRKVLVVEDDQLLRNLLAVKLTKNNYEPMYVDDGAKAIETARSFQPSIILLDLMLPGVDGFGILADLKKDETLRDVPVMVFSNKSGNEDKEKAVKLGASAFRVKAHTDLNEVIQELEKLTGGS